MFIVNVTLVLSGSLSTRDSLSPRRVTRAAPARNDYQEPPGPIAGGRDHPRRTRSLQVSTLNFTWPGDTQVTPQQKFETRSVFTTSLAVTVGANGWRDKADNRNRAKIKNKNPKIPPYCVNFYHIYILCYYGKKNTNDIEISVLFFIILLMEMVKSFLEMVKFDTGSSIMDIVVLMVLTCTASCYYRKACEENSCHLALCGSFVMHFVIGMSRLIHNHLVSRRKTKFFSKFPQPDFNLSRVENALRLLDFVLKAEVSEDIKTCARYCIDAFKSSGEELNIPLGLLTCNSTSCDPQQIEESVQDWLLSQFSMTSKCSTAGTPEFLDRRKSTISLSSDTLDPCDLNLGLASTAQSQQFAIPNTFGVGILFECQPAAAGLEANAEGMDLALPFQTGPEERQDILDTLRGVDSWDWDVFALHRASQGRELEVCFRPMLCPTKRSQSHTRQVRVIVTGFPLVWCAAAAAFHAGAGLASAARLLGTARLAGHRSAGAAGMARLRRRNLQPRSYLPLGHPRRRRPPVRALHAQGAARPAPTAVP